MMLFLAQVVRVIQKLAQDRIVCIFVSTNIFPVVKMEHALYCKYLLSKGALSVMSKQQ